MAPFYTVSRAEWEKVIRVDWTNTRKYSLKDYRCTNFAWSFKARVFDIFGLSCGWVLTAKHSFNVIYFADGTWAFFEPQNDRFVEIGSGIYDMARATVMY